MPSSLRIAQQNAKINRQNGHGKQKKLKMRQMVAIYRKEDTPEMDMKLTSQGRKKCKNPNCRCRERKRKGRKRKEEGENGRKGGGEEEGGMVENGLDLARKGEGEEVLLEEEDGGTSGEGQVQEEKEKEEAVDGEGAELARATLNFGFPKIRAQLLAECFCTELEEEGGQNEGQSVEMLKRAPKMAKLMEGQLARVGEKKVQLEKSHKLNCTTVGLVTRKLLLKDPALKESLLPSFLAVVRDFEQEIWKEMDEFIGRLIGL